MSLAVEMADGVSERWRRRFVRTSAALGEEAITSDVILALEEDLAPFVRRVKSFTRAEEGGSHGPPTGADFEVHFVSPDGLSHFAYRVQAKLAKLDYNPAVFTYDFDYTTRGGKNQLDALISSASVASCIPMYFLYNSPSAVGSMLAQTPPPGAFLRWQAGHGCWHQHVTRIDAALTIAAVPARLARRASTRSSRRLTDATAVSGFMTPWSCLLHHSPHNQRLSVGGLREQMLARLDWLHWWPDLTDGELEALDVERAYIEEYVARAQSLPEDVARLAQGDADFTLADLARDRSSSNDDGDESVGDSALAALLIVELDG